MISKALYGLLLCYILVSVCSAGPAAPAAAASATTKTAHVTVAVVNATAASNATKDAALAKFIDGFVGTLEPLTPQTDSMIANITKMAQSSKKLFADLKVCSKALKGGKATQAQKDKAAASVQAFGKEAKEVILQLSTLAKVGGAALDGLFNSTMKVVLLPKLNLTLITPVPKSTAAPPKAATAAPKKG